MIGAWPWWGWGFLVSAIGCTASLVLWLLKRTPETSVSRYTVGLAAPLTIGRAGKLTAEVSPQIPCPVEQILTNAPCPGFVILHHLLFDRRDILMGPVDASTFGQLAFSAPLHLPMVREGGRIEVVGEYTGLVPPGYPRSMESCFTLCMTTRPIPTTVQIRNWTRLAKRLRNVYWRLKWRIRDRFWPEADEADDP